MYVQHLTQAMMGVEELLAALFLLPHNLAISGSLSSSRSSSLEKGVDNWCGLNPQDPNATDFR